MTTERDTGFTLPELLVALFIFGLLSAASVGLLALGVDTRARAGERLDGQAALARTRALLTADLEQAAARPWRDGTGIAQPALAADGARFTLVRRGWRNDGGAARASLQRVTWRLVEGRLERLAAPHVDGGEAGTPAVLLTGVSALRLRWHAADAWRDIWAPADPAALPQALEMTLVADGLPELTQSFLIAPGSGR